MPLAPVWQDFGEKKLPKFFKKCPESNHSSFYLKYDGIQMAEKLPNFRATFVRKFFTNDSSYKKLQSQLMGASAAKKNVFVELVPAGCCSR